MCGHARGARASNFLLIYNCDVLKQGSIMKCLTLSGVVLCVEYIKANPSY